MAAHAGVHTKYTIRLILCTGSFPYTHRSRLWWLWRTVNTTSYIPSLQDLQVLEEG